MARRTRSSKLETRSNRLRLEIKTKPYSVMIAPRIHLCYRRNDGPGSWSVKAHNWLRRFAIADDHEDANGDSVMSYWQALEKAKQLARVGEGNDTPITVKQAVEDYKADLEIRGGQKFNATTLMRCHLSDTLASKSVALLKKRDLSDWRTGLIKKGLKVSTANRTATALRSALNLAASNDPGIANANAWHEGLRPLPLPDAYEDKLEANREGFILNDQAIAAVVRAAYEDGREHGDHFGELIDTLAETGARESQVYKLKVRHLEDGGSAPHLRMPPSRKGINRKNARKKESVQTPISRRLAKQLRLLAGNRAADAPLIDKIRKLNLRFRPVIKKLGLDEKLSVYCLRHSSIARQLLRGLPLRVTAVNHDSSAAMIETYYNRHVANHTDAMTRATLLDLDVAPADNIVKFARAAE